MPDRKNKTPETMAIELAFRNAGYDSVTAYRLEGSYSIRVRVIDDRFHGRSRVERETMVWPLVQALPEEIQADLTVLLLLAPEEQNKSLMNLEFEDPARALQ